MNHFYAYIASHPIGMTPLDCATIWQFFTLCWPCVKQNHWSKNPVKIMKIGTHSSWGLILWLSAANSASIASASSDLTKAAMWGANCCPVSLRMLEVLYNRLPGTWATLSGRIKEWPSCCSLSWHNNEARRRQRWYHYCYVWLILLGV